MECLTVCAYYPTVSDRTITSGSSLLGRPILVTEQMITTTHQWNGVDIHVRHNCATCSMCQWRDIVYTACTV